MADFNDVIAGYIRVSADRVTELGAMELLQLCLGLEIRARPNTWRAGSKSDGDASQVDLSLLYR
jgi:hypothetical protein